MAEKTYNTGRVVGWSSYEEFLKETKTDPNIITNYVYNTLVTYGVTRRIELTPTGWVASNGGQFYTQTIRVPGASWGAVPIVGLDYESYVDVFTHPGTTTKEVEAVDAEEKDILEEAVGNIFGVYVSDARGNKAASAVAEHGYLTFCAYPDILDFNGKIPTIGGILRLIVRGLSLEDLDVNTLYYGPQGFIFAGNGLVEDCYHETRDINNLSLNSAGYLWIGMGGNQVPADYRALVNHPNGNILVSTFGYLDLDFLYGTGAFSKSRAYGLTYAEYQDALQGVKIVTTQVDVIKEDDRKDYVYLVAGEPSYEGYPPDAHPFFIFPVKKDTGRINVGDFSRLETPKMKKIMDFTRTYGNDDKTVLYMYDKKLPDYFGSYWGKSCPDSDGLVYLGNNSLNNSWYDTPMAEVAGASYHRTGRNACWKFTDTSSDPVNKFDKAYYYVLYNQTDAQSSGFYLCTKDTKYTDTIVQLNRIGGYINWNVPQWYKKKREKDGAFAFELDLSGLSATIRNGVLEVGGVPIYPGEPLLIGNQDYPDLVYVWNTVKDGKPKLICRNGGLITGELPTFVFNATLSQGIIERSDTHSHKIIIPRDDWDSAVTNRTLDVFTDATHHDDFTPTVGEVISGSLVTLKHKKQGVWGYDKDYRYIVLDCTSDFVTLASAMVWVDNPNLSNVVGYPGKYNAAVPRYNQPIPKNNSYYYNMKSVLSRLTARKVFQDFGWDIADYVDEEFQNMSWGEFLRECVLRKDLSVPSSPDTLRAYGLESHFDFYSKKDLNYTSGKIPEPTPTKPIHSSIRIAAKTTTKSFFETVPYKATTPSGDVVNINNVDYPIWVTVAKSRHGKQTMSVSVIDDNGSQLDFSGNDGDIEADKINWLDLLTGLGTGKAVDVLHGMRVRRTKSDCNYLLTADGTRLYISTTPPDPDKEDIDLGSIGIGW